jgi:fatty acid desaturase
MHRIVDVTSARDTATAGRASGAVPERAAYLGTRHSWLNVAHILGDHALLLAWFVVAPRWLPWFVYVPGSLLACVIHQRAMSEWVHEGAHHNLVRNRKLNDLLTDVLAGVWFLMPVRTYRATHFVHHAKPAFFVPDDPDTNFLDIASRRDFRRGVLRDLSGLSILGQFTRFGEKAPVGLWGWRVAGLLLHATVITIAFLFGRLDVPLLYYVSLATLYPLLNRLRVYGQHVTIDTDGRSHFRDSATSRTIDGNWWDRILHTSPRLMYHHEHHAYPHLPYRALRTLVEPDTDVNRYARRRVTVLRAVYRGLPN